MPTQVEWQMWRQLRGAFNIDRIIFVPVLLDEKYHQEQYDTVAEVLATCEGSRVFLEPKGTKSVSQLPDGDIVLVVGNTNKDNLKHAEDGETYRINTPARTHLYGHDAVAIALALRFGQ